MKLWKVYIAGKEEFVMVFVLIINCGEYINISNYNQL